MGLFEFFWNASQESRLSSARSSAIRTSSELRGTQDHVVELRAAIDRLALVNQAMWELVRERTNLTDTDLELRILEIDSRDGRVDGRIGRVMSACPNCGRPNGSDRSECFYCEATL